MDQFLSRFTFGLLMAQVFPGGVFLLSLTSPMLAYRQSPATMSQLFLGIGNLWFNSTKSAAVFLFIAGGLGMFIHGISWIVMAWLENHEKKGDRVTPVRESFWHECKLGFQVLLSPIKMLLEMLWVLRAPNIDSLAMEESGAFILPADKPIYDFFQDFYLYFAQFYSHTAYALLFSLFSMVATWLIIGFTIPRAILVLLVYFATSMFFLIGRVQFASLFKAENVLRKRGTVV